MLLIKWLRYVTIVVTTIPSLFLRMRATTLDLLLYLILYEHHYGCHMWCMISLPFWSTWDTYGFRVGFVLQSSVFFLCLCIHCCFGLFLCCHVVFNGFFTYEFGIDHLVTFKYMFQLWTLIWTRLTFIIIQIYGSFPKI